MPVNQTHAIHRQHTPGTSLALGHSHGITTCRCYGALEQVLHAAVVAEDVSLHSCALTSDAQLAALLPAAGTLRALDAFDMSGTVRFSDGLPAVAVRG